MNFRQPQRQRQPFPASPIESRRRTRKRKDSASARSNRSLSSAMNDGPANVRHSSGDGEVGAVVNESSNHSFARIEGDLAAAHATNNNISDRHYENAHPPAQPPTMTKITDSPCMDPPITTYDSSPDEGDDTSNDAGSISSESSQRRRRRQLRELAVQSDDCWTANLSDDEDSVDALPLEWNASMVRRQMMRQSGNSSRNVTAVSEEDIGNNKAVGAISQQDMLNVPQQTLNLQGTNYSPNDEIRHDSYSSNESLGGGGMSLPEQLLQKRLRRKERLHKKHEQFVRYQHHQYSHNQHQQEQQHQQQHPKQHSEREENYTAEQNMASFRTPSPDKKRSSRNHLSAKNNSELRASSPLFPDEEFDDDNASTVASSNGASNDYSHLRYAQHTSCEQSEQLGGQSASATVAAAAASSPLHSLPQRPICPFPEEADRKRIVGCLAAILASSYAYETAPQLLVKEKRMGKGKSIEEDVASKKRNVDGERSSTAVELNMSRSMDVPDISTDGSTDGSSFEISVQGDVEDDESYNDSTYGKTHPHLQQHKRQQHLIQQQSRESQQPHPSRSPTPSFRDSFTAAFQKNTPPNRTAPNRSHSSIDIGARKSTTSNPMASLQHSFSFASFQNNRHSAKRMFDHPGSQNPPPSLTTELAEIRHRIRRHAILSELLVSSAEMLLLEPSHAKAFLPMLEGLLSKVEVPETTNAPWMDRSGHNSASRQSWKGRGFGGGGMPSPGSGVEANTEALAQLSMQPSKGPPPLPAALISCEGRCVSSKNTDLKSISERSTCEGGDASEPIKSLHDTNTTKPGSSSKAYSSVTKKQQSSCQDSSNPAYAPLDTAIVEKDLVAPFLQTLTPGAGFRCIALLLLNHLLRDGRGYDARVRQAFKRLAVIVLSHELKVGGILCADVDDEDALDELLWGEGGMTQQNNSSYEEIDGKDINDDEAEELARLATRKFEAMEHAIAAKLISMSRGNDNTRTKESAPRNKNADTQQQTSESRSSRASRQEQSSSRASKKSGSVASSPSSSRHGRIALAPKETPLSSQHGISREQLLRGIKVGTAGAVGATLFALTGGLAAPGIAAGLAAVAGTSAIAAGVSTVLSSAAAISTIFGVGGAGLASYKMHRRTKGLTEFNFHKEAVTGKDTEAELFSTVCISGWLRDARDFQRPWGVSPSHPRIIDKQELLERFYFIHNPSNVFRVGEILKHWKGRYFQLWRALREKYGSDPSNLFPLDEGPRISAELTHEEGEAVDYLLDELGYFPKQKPPKKSSFFGTKADEDDGSKGASSTRPKSSPSSESKKLQSAQKQLKDSSMRPRKWLPDINVTGSDIAASTLSIFSESETNSINDNSVHTVGSVPNASNKGSKPTGDLGKNPPPKHLLTVWDYHANYGGELYTVQWESELLMELCDSVTDQMIEWGISATKTILHTTVFATLMTAVTLPYSLVMASHAIDSSWTMAMERADRAGVELAKSLIDSTAGHRPVILAGFSMGARVIYSCLKELARHQEIWEDHQQKKQLPATRRKHNAKGEDKGDPLKYIREPASIVEDAILMGTPNHVSLKSWEACRRVVAGRVINCYSRKDLILSLMFQMKRFQGILRPVCGTSPVAVKGVENYDVTDLVAAHTDYCLVSGEILKRVRHGQPQRASVSKTEVSAMVTTINVANKDIGALAALSDETAVGRG